MKNKFFSINNQNKKVPSLLLLLILALLIIGLIVLIYFLSNKNLVASTQNLSTSPPITETRTTSPASPNATSTANVAIPKIATSSSKSSEVKGVSKLPKSSYSIALIGDSLIDTMGENTDYLQKSLSAKYPGTEFKLFNYGIGGQNVEQGLGRFNSPFNFKTRNYPPLAEIHPDILIVGSFSYNPFPEHDVAKHNRLLQALINQARGTGAKVYLLAEIAPLKTGFGDGPGGVNWPPDRAALQAQHIIEQLNDTVALAKTENVPLINTFQASKMNGNYGNQLYVSTNDGIHPSVEGHIFMANIIANILKF